MQMTLGSITLEQLAGETGWLRRLAASLVKDQAEDVVHDTLLIAAARAPTDRPLRPWLARVLVNRVRTLGRGGARRRKREHALGELAAAPAGPDEIVDRIKLHRLLAGYVLELAQPERDVVLLHYFEGLTSIEIGNRLGISDGTVRWRLKQAIDELRRRLDDHAPNRGWVAPMLGLAKEPAGGIAMSSFVLAALAAIAIIVAIVAIPRASTAISLTAGAADERAEPVDRAQGSISPLAAPAPSAGRPYIDLEDRRLSGRVVDQTLKPVAGAEVVLGCGYSDGVPEATTLTPADGTYAFDVDPHCDYSIVATKGNAIASTAYYIRRDDGFSPLELRLAPSPTAVIRVVDARTGAAIANARLTSHNFRTLLAAHVTSDAAGIARIRWLAKPTWVNVEAPGYVATRTDFKEVTAPAGEVERTVALARGAPIAGVVLGPDGRPVAGAHVRITRPTDDGLDYFSAQTGVDGAFEVTVPAPGRYSVEAAHEDFVASPSTVLAVGPEGRADLALELARGGEIVGTVVDLAGKPVRGARIHAARGGITRRQTRPPVTDDHGRFEIHNISDENLLAQYGHMSSAWKHVAVAPGQRAEVQLEVGPSGLAGVVVDAKGNPIANAEVWLNFCCDPGPVLVGGTSTLTDDHGRFGIETPRGDFVLSVRHDTDDDFDDADDARVQGGARDIRVVLP